MIIRNHLIKKIIITIGIVLIVAVFSIIVYIRYFSKSKGITFYSNEKECIENYEFILEKGHIENIAKCIKLINKYQSNIYSEDYNEIFCIEVENFPQELNDKQKQIWHKFPIKDSNLNNILNNSLSLNKPTKDIDTLLGLYGISKSKTNGIEWIPTIDKLNKSYMVAFVSSVNSGKKTRNRLLLYNKEKRFLYYFNIFQPNL